MREDRYLRVAFRACVVLANLLPHIAHSTCAECAWRMNRAERTDRRANRATSSLPTACNAVGEVAATALELALHRQQAARARVRMLIGANRRWESPIRRRLVRGAGATSRNED